MHTMLITLTTTVIANVPVIMTILALILSLINLVKNNPRSLNDIFLGKLLFYAVGISGFWGFVMYAFFPLLAAKYIGWTSCPFQFYVAAFCLGMGVAGIFALHASRGYQIATTIFTTCFLWGAATEHITQMISHKNFSAGNAGALFTHDIFLPLLLIYFLLRKEKNGELN